MAAILTFVLVAPFGAMGSVAVGERRAGWDRPGRSAVLGLIAGCLGLERTEEESHAALSSGLGLAIRREGPATPLLSDYHTAQTAPARKKRAFSSRSEELSADERETMLTRRDYRADIAFTVALWRRPSSQPPWPWTLESLAEAMTAPRFVPYLGRKCCPLGLPMQPRINQAETIREAFAQRDASASALEHAALRPLRRAGGGMVWADRAGPDEPELGLQEAYNELRRDQLLNRVRWQFSLREEVAAHWPEHAA